MRKALVIATVILLAACGSKSGTKTADIDTRSGPSDVAPERTDGIGDVGGGDHRGKPDVADGVTDQGGHETKAIEVTLDVVVDVPSDAPDVLEVLEDVPCIPDCGAKACGDDGCGQICPSQCTTAQECNDEGKCEDAIKLHWMRKLSSLEWIRITDGAARPGGGLVLAGQILGEEVSLDGDVVQQTSLGPTFVAAFDADGELEWLDRFPHTTYPGSAFTHLLLSLSVASDHGVAFVGIGGGQSWDMGCGLPDYPSLAFVARLDAYGECQWTRTFDAYLTIPKSTVAVQADDGVYVVAEIKETCGDFGGGLECAPQGLPGDERLIVVMYDAQSGDHLWTRWIEGSVGWYMQISQPLAAGAPGVTLGGNTGSKKLVFSETVVLDPVEKPYDFLVNYSPEGEAVWAKSYQGSGFARLVHAPGYGYVGTGPANAAIVAPDGTLLEDSGWNTWLINSYDEVGELVYRGQLEDIASCCAWDFNAAPGGDLFMAVDTDYFSGGEWPPISLVRSSLPYDTVAWRVELKGINPGVNLEEEIIFDSNGQEHYVAFRLGDAHLNIDGQILAPEELGDAIYVMRVEQ